MRSGAASRWPGGTLFGFPVVVVENLFGAQTGREPCGDTPFADVKDYARYDVFAGGQYLVPVRRGGPWMLSSSRHWEVWRNGKYTNSCKHSYRVYEGYLQHGHKSGTWKCSSENHDLHEIELRAPKDYDGPCPEGCRWVEDENVNRPLQDGDRVRATQGMWAGMVGTFRPNDIYPFQVEWDAGQDWPSTGFSDEIVGGLVRIAEEWAPKVGDRVAHAESGILGWITRTGSDTWGKEMLVTWDTALSSGSVYGWWPISALKLAPRVRPDGTLDLPVRKVRMGEWKQITKHATSCPKLPMRALFHKGRFVMFAHPERNFLIRIEDDQIQYTYHTATRWWVCSNLDIEAQPGDEDHMEWIVCDDA